MGGSSELAMCRSFRRERIGSPQPSSGGTLLTMRFGWLIALPLIACGSEEVVERASPPPVVDDRGIVPDIDCPGTAGCESASGAFRAGAAVRVITPELEAWSDDNEDGTWNEGESYEDSNGNGRWDPLWLAGFQNGRPAKQIADDIWARALVVERGDVSVGLVVLDLVGLFHQDVVAIRLAAQKLGLDHVMVATTHNHEGPDTMGMYGASFGETGYDPLYVEGQVVTATVEALAEAKAAARPALMRYARTEAPDLVRDIRFPIVIDQALTAMQFEAVDGGLIATAVVWGNHPETLGSGNRSVTSDYPHYLRKSLEDAYGGAPALFFNGSLGGLSTPIGVTGCPDALGEETCPEGTFERARFIGEGAAAKAIEALESDPGIAQGGDLTLGVRRRSILLGTTNVKLALAVTIGLMPRALHEAESGRRLNDEEVREVGLMAITDGDVKLQTEINLIEIGPLSIATVPGELYPELWLVAEDGGVYIERPEGGDYPDAELETPIQSLLPAGRIPVIINNANDALGYIIPRAQWDEAAPHAYQDDESDGPQYGEDNSLGPGTAQSLCEVFRVMGER